MKRKVLSSLLQEVNLLAKLPEDLIDKEGVSLGFCSFVYHTYINSHTQLIMKLLTKYKKEIPERKIYWFNPGDWKIRLSFLNEVIKIELNPFYKLMYKLGLYKFKY